MPAIYLCLVPCAYNLVLMQPLSFRTRLIALGTLSLLFLVVVPLVMLYANGWRFSPALGFYKTGGVFVAVPYAGVTVSINGEVIGITGLLQRSFYIDNLSASTYVLRVSGANYYPWERMVVVEPQLVTDTRAFLVRTDIDTVQLVATSTATSTGQVVSPAVYAEYVALFAAPRVASSTLPVDAQENTGLFVVEGDLIARWTNPNSPIPSFFCMRPSLCSTEFPIERSSDTVTDAAFFAGGVVYSTRERGLYFTEADARPTPRIIPLYEKPDVDFRIVNGALIVKDGKDFYHVEL